MPIGSSINESGLLLCDGAALILRRDSGGRWRLDLDKVPHDLIGRRVSIRGTRGDFDVVDVVSICAEGEPLPLLPNRRFDRATLGAALLVAASLLVWIMT
jgi:hypothetical protein